MVSLILENASVEFNVHLASGSHAAQSSTGGVIHADRNVVTALDNISFELKQGDRLGLMGHNGAGKSTMLRLLAGAYAPTSGRMISVGRVSTLLNTLPGLNIDGTGRENIVTCGLHLGMSLHEIKAKMEEIVDFAELGDYVDLPVRIYSSGMVTRLGFSIATCVDPEILLLDEGLATGDAQFAQKAQNKMNDLISRAPILVIASHSQTLLADVCNRCILLEHGKIVSDSTAEDVLDFYQKSIVASAQSDDIDGLQKAYTMATDMAKRGQLPSLDLEEQGLRYALKIAPDDIQMLRRYVAVLKGQGKEVPAEISERISKMLEGWT